MSVWSSTPVKIINPSVRLDSNDVLAWFLVPNDKISKNAEITMQIIAQRNIEVIRKMLVEIYVAIFLAASRGWDFAMVPITEFGIPKSNTDKSVAIAI